MNKKLFTLVYILIFLTTISVSAATTLGTTPGTGTLVDTNTTGAGTGFNTTGQLGGITPTNTTGTTPPPGTTPGSSITPTTPEQQKTLVQMLFTSKDCNYVKDKQYQPFSGIDTSFPGIGSSLTKSKQNPKVTCVNVSNATEDIVKMLFTVGITVIIILTVISIAVSGIQYITEEAVGKKGAAKKRLTNSFIALGLGLLSYTILYTVNKKLVEFDFNPSDIDIDKSIQKGINQVLTTATSSWVGNISGIDAVLNQNPGWSFPNNGIPNIPYTGNPTDNPMFNSVLGWTESGAENFIRSLPNGIRSTDGRLVVTVYSATKDSITDSNTAQKRGNSNNLLREGSVALSPDLISKHRPSTGQTVFINGTCVGFYEDATASSYNGIIFANTIDIYDENGTIGSNSVLKNIPAGQWNITFGTARAQISNP